MEFCWLVLSSLFLLLVFLFLRLVVDDRRRGVSSVKAALGLPSPLICGTLTLLVPTRLMRLTAKVLSLGHCESGHLDLGFNAWPYEDYEKHHSVHGKRSNLRWSKAQFKAAGRLGHILKNLHSTVEDKKQRPEDWRGQNRGHKPDPFPDIWPHPQGPAPHGLVHRQKFETAANSATAFYLKGSGSRYCRTTV